MKKLTHQQKYVESGFTITNNTFAGTSKITVESSEDRSSMIAKKYLLRGGHAKNLVKTRDISVNRTYN